MKGLTKKCFARFAGKTTRISREMPTTYVSWASTAALSHTPSRSPGARRPTARLNTLQACYMHELLQASFAGKQQTGQWQALAFTMLRPPKKKATSPAARRRPPGDLEPRQPPSIGIGRRALRVSESSESSDHLETALL